MLLERAGGGGGGLGGVPLNDPEGYTTLFAFEALPASHCRGSQKRRHVEERASDKNFTQRGATLQQRLQYQVYMCQLIFSA